MSLIRDCVCLVCVCVFACLHEEMCVCVSVCILICQQSVVYMCVRICLCVEGEIVYGSVPRTLCIHCMRWNLQATCVCVLCSRVPCVL